MSKTTDTTAPGAGFLTDLPQQPVMHEHPIPALDSKLAQPYGPRANIAASVEQPQGTTKGDWAAKHKDESVLEQHVLYFDRDGDGVIWPQDTFVALYELGFNLLLCLVGVLVIHPALSYPTGDSWLPDPLFRISVKGVYRGKHGSDTGTYDHEGRFVPSKFESIFSQYDKENKGGLTYREGLRMVRGNRDVADFFGWGAALFEWTLTYLLVWPKDGIFPKEAMRAVYDGSLFFEIADKEKEKGRKKLASSGLEKVLSTDGKEGGSQ